MQLRKRPLTAAEFVFALSKIDPIYKEEEEAFKVSPETPCRKVSLDQTHCNPNWLYSSSIT